MKIMKKVVMTSVMVSMLLSGCGVTFGYSREETEDIEVAEKPEMSEIPENPEILEIPEITEKSGEIREMEIKEVENTWPEKISYQADGVYGDPISTVMEIEHPVTLSIVCETLDGELKLKIADQDGKEVFSMDNPDGAYTVEIEKAGIYQVLFYAKEHVGNVEITPVEE